jgi:hypothetical protein
MPAPSAPGAASTLVSSASLDPAVTGLAPPPPPDGAPLDGAPLAAAPPEVGSAEVVPPPAGVGLVFADGASVELAADDPRVRTFRAAAAALVEPPTR